MVLPLTVVAVMVGANAAGRRSTPMITPAVAGGPLVRPQLFPPGRELPVMVVPVTTSWGAWAWTMMPPSYEPVTVLLVTDTLLTVAFGDAAATTMPPTSGPALVNTPGLPVMEFPVIVPPTTVPPVLWVA